ncbi:MULTISPECIES: DUF6531 domain-containing protein [Pseudomonas]|uniref:DUF6531 domain-containing protein n=1 Tax=Pseudomonas TaxID=286 RepID=UPI001FF61A84|nr:MULTISPECIES: DUF6531 domain-containing protein [Pseudomonas]
MVRKYGALMSAMGDCGVEFDHLDLYSGICYQDGEALPRKEAGNPASTPGCGGISTAQGNPINAATGNKFQDETDFEDKVFSIHRYYNSTHKIWQFSYSESLEIGIQQASLVKPDGTTSIFSLDSNKIATAESTETGSLVFDGTQWLYTDSQRNQLAFDTSGNLISIKPLTSGIQTITTIGVKKIITSPMTGEVMEITPYGTGVQSFKIGTFEIVYTYDDSQRLINATKNYNGTLSTRLYHYEDAANPFALTGITDERGVRMATWSYDSQGRAISSEHAGGAGKTLLAYNPDGSTSVTNELGKVATYNFQNFQGARRVTSIIGEPSPGCSASNSSYEYDDAGRVVKKTDNTGVVTTYTYNSRGLMTSHTEGAGSAEPRVTNVGWAPDSANPTSIDGSGKIISYAYDHSGNKISTTITGPASPPPPPGGFPPLPPPPGGDGTSPVPLPHIPSGVN